MPWLASFQQLAPFWQTARYRTRSIDGATASATDCVLVAAAVYQPAATYFWVFTGARLILVPAAPRSRSARKSQLKSPSLRQGSSLRLPRVARASLRHLWPPNRLPPLLRCH